jgi:hypothetical protein
MRSAPHEGLLDGAGQRLRVGVRVRRFLASSWTRTSLRNPPISSASGDLTHLSGSDGRELGDRWAYSSPAVQWEGELAGLPVPAASMSVGGGRGNLSSRAPLDEALPSVGSFHLFFFWNTLLMNIYGHKLTIFPESACGT